MADSSSNSSTEDGKKLSVSRIRNDGEHWVDAHSTFVGGGVEYSKVDDEEVDTSTSWEIIEWDEVREEAAKKILANESNLIEEDQRILYETELASRWETFYSRNKQNFFKNRTYIGKEYPELSGPNTSNTERTCVLEVGCGVGNSVWPLLELNPDKFFFAFDCSPSAIEIVKSHQNYNPKFCSAFVLDICSGDFDAKIIAPNSIDIILLTFALSAMPPLLMPSVLRKLYKILRPGGIVYLRDYGRYDMTQMRFFARGNAKMGENFYRRGDGTFAYFFEQAETNKMFEDAGFSMLSSKYDTRVLQNRKRKLKMYRVWFTAKYQKK